MIRAAALLVLVACSPSASPKLDGGDVRRDGSLVEDDAAETRDASETSPDALVIDGPPGAYRHTIVVDGVDDFTPGELFATTSASYAAKVTWDDQFVYIGYQGPDLDPGALDAATKWLFAYVDIDPGASTGAATSETYRTQTASFPTGFGAEYYARWKCDATFANIQQFAGTWMASAGTLATARAGQLVELAIPRSLLGNASTIGVVTWMINEKDNFEGTFAGLYANNFTDGYAMTLPLTRYLKIDFAAARVPNDPANVAP